MTELARRQELAPTERERLDELESVVERGLTTFTEVGRALMEIRDARLYRESHETFEAYLDARWAMSRSRGYRLIDAAHVAELVSPMGDIQNERQARELVPLLREDEAAVLDVWRELRCQHGDRVTADKVRASVRERLRFEQKIGALKSSNSVEWYTPAAYVEAVREALGGIDLDPASCAEANETVQAATFYDLARDGLAQPWFGRVFCNPPYGRACGDFVARAGDQYAAGNVEAVILLLNAYATDVSWFRPLWDYFLCFTDHRLDFYSPVHQRTSPTTGSVFVYLGPEPARFARSFSRFGAVVERSPLAVAEAA